MKIITVASVSLPALSQSYLYSETLVGIDTEFRFHYLGNGRPGLSLLDDIRSSDIVITDLMGIPNGLYTDISRSVKECKGIRICIGGMALQLNRLGKFDERRMKNSAEDEKNLEHISLAWKRAEYRDMEFIYSLLLGHYLSMDSVKVMPYSECMSGVYIKDSVTLEEFPSPREYRSDIHGDYDVALLFNGSNYPNRTISVSRRLFERLSEKWNVLPIAMNSYSMADVDDLRRIIGRPKVIVNLLPFRFMAGPMGGDSVSANWLLKELDVPLLSPFAFSRTSYEKWKDDPNGMDPMDFMLNVFLPELDGAYCTIPIGFQKDLKELDDGITLSESAPFEERIDRICGKVDGIISISSKKNSEKRIALIAYNYPPGEDNLFGGSFLDGAGSISNILKILKENGYTTDPMDSSDIVSGFISKGLINEGKWHDAKEAIRFRNKDPHDVRISDYWGPPPGKVMCDDGGYIIPGMKIGNVFIGIQPPRSSDSKDASAYHDQHIPPHHQYAAFYDWIMNVFKADAIIHLGTHGTIEFLPGKEKAVSGDCFPDSLLGGIHHVYLYYAGNPSEAMIAKRRTHAAIVSYMPPPMVKSELYGEMAALENKIAEYRESRETDPGRAESLLSSIKESAENMRLPPEIDDLEDELTDMKESLIPFGLHAFGSRPTEEQSENYASTVYDGRFRQEDLISRYRDNLEAENLIRILNGRYIEPASGGDIMMDPDVLPSGRNIVQFNPDKVPTMTAFDRGVQAANDIVEGFYKATGRYPESAGIILWGLETSRTQGMSIGQICGYLGLRMVSDSGEFSHRFEAIPIEELKRPRVDVVVTICGFFRDMFPKLIGGLDDLFRMVSELDEGDMNQIRRHSGDNKVKLHEMKIDDPDLPTCRLFGPSHGQYGTGLTGIVNSSQWKDEGELGDSFVSSLHYAYTSKRSAADIPNLLRVNQSRIDVISQIRDSTDREIIDLDHYYEFLGGLSKSVEMAKGVRSMSFVVDGSRKIVRTSDLRRSIEHGVRTRLLNPKWIDGLLEVNYHGAQKVNDRFENVLGLAATTGEVGSSIFSDMLSTYVTDEKLRGRMRENNRWAYLSMLERLLEANEREYWDASEEELKTLREAFLETEEDIEKETEE